MKGNREMEKFFNQDAMYEKWNRRNKNKGRDNYFKEDDISYLKDLKGSIQNNLSGYLRIVLTALIVLLQCLFIIVLSFAFQNLTVYFYFTGEIISVIAIVTLVNRNHSPSYRLAWTSIVTLMPVSGFIMYCLWGRAGKSKRRLDQNILRQISYGNQFLLQDEDVYLGFITDNPVQGRMVKYMATEGFPITAGNNVDFYSMGEDVFEAIFRDLEKAEKFILIDFFIVAEGGIWDKMHEILKHKIDEGVEVKFLYDDFGTAIRTRKFFKQILEHEGFEVRVFNPVHKYMGELYMNFRSHQKILVIDGEVGYTGGFNLADEYANLIERFGVWKDTGIRIVGEAVWGLTVVFLQMWEASANLDGHIDYLKYRADFKQSCGGVYCQVISDGPANNPSNPIESIYNQMIVFSDKYLYITTPYLIIEDYMKISLIEAAKRGVDVRIITPGIPDKKNVKLLTNYNYGPLLREGVRIYEYTPGFIHAKQIVTENAVIVGTINMDYRSFYLHYENGVWMSGKEIQEAVRKDFFDTFEVSKEITYDDWLARPYTWKMVQPLLNLFSTLF